MACVSEHWLRGGAELGLRVQGYVVAAMHSRSTMSRGGVCILVKDTLVNEYDSRDVSYLNLDQHFESVAIYMPKLRTLVVTVYRSPSGDIDSFFQKLDELLKRFVKVKTNVFLCGDFNIHFWSSSREDLRLSDLIHSYNLRATITDVTRPSDSGGSCIDNIITNLGPDRCSARVLSACISDHEAQVIDFLNTSSSDVLHPKKTLTRNFSQTNKDRFCQEMSNINWVEFLKKHDSVDMQFTEFHNLFLRLYNRHFPLFLKTTSRKNRQNWISRDIIKAKQELRDWYHLRCDFPDFYSHIYQSKRKEYRRLIAASKAAAAERHISSSKNVGKAVWQVVKGTSGCDAERKFISEIESKGCLLSQPKHIASAFNDHFINASVFSSTMPSGFSTSSAVPPPRYNQSSLFLRPADENEVLEVFNNLNNSKARDVYDVSPSFIKSVSNCLITPLTILFNNSLLEGVFPSMLKTSKVVPVFKKGEKHSINNYRPISILPSFSKVFERLMYNRLMDFLIKHSIIASNQFGFLRGKSTADAINAFLTEVMSALDKGDDVFGLFCDLRLAFDTVDHEILLKKLEEIGIRGLAAMWIASFLTGRWQCVEITHPLGSVFSEIKRVMAGVPQGSILGPLLFLLYVNDLSLCVDGHLIQYVDDTSAVGRGRSKDGVKNKLLELLKQLGFYFYQNKLSLNMSKTSVVQFSLKNNKQDIAVKYENNYIEPCNSVKFLGVNIDSDLKWGSQIDHIARCLNKSIYSLRQLSSFLPKSTLKLVYYGYVYPHLTYGIMSWGTANKSSLERVLIQQKRALRIICGLGYRESCREHFRREEILTVPSLFISAISIYVFKNPYLFSSHTHSYDTRNKHELVAPAHRLALFDKSLLSLGPKIFNKLPDAIKNCTTFRSFKRNLKSFLVEKTFYTLNEFYSL